MKGKLCKCGHEHPYSTWVGVRNCKQCDCNYWIDSRFPKRSDKIMYTIMIVAIAFVTAVLLIGFFAFSPLIGSEDPKLDEPTFTLRHAIMIIVVACLIGALWFGGWCIDIIKEYRHKKKTPIKLNSENL